MKSALVIGILASVAFAGSVQSQSAEPELPWVKIAKTNDGEVLYVNVESIKDLGGGIKQAWELSNYNQPRSLPDGSKYLSQKTKTKHKCIDESVTILTIVSYSKPSGAGDVLSSIDLKPHEIEWSSIVPDSIGEMVLNFVCEYN